MQVNNNWQKRMINIYTCSVLLCDRTEQGVVDSTKGHEFYSYSNPVTYFNAFFL